MRIAHLSDSHLGHLGRGSREHVASPFHADTWLPLRAVDILVAFERAISLIIDQVRPDLVIHSGDLFDSAAPTMSVVDFAMRQFRRLAEAEIPVLVIEGNQSYPRLRAMGHVLQLLAYLPGVRVVWEEQEVVRFGHLPLTLHALPHAALAAGAIPRREDVDPGRINVLVAHGVADGMPFYRAQRPAPPVFLGSCEDWYDYIALGHCHRFCQANLRRRAFYAGATTMITWGDFAAGQGFSLNSVDFGGDEPVVRGVPIPGRPMHAYGLDDASGLSATEILDLLDRQSGVSPPDDAYCFVQVGSIDALAGRDLDRREVETRFALAAGLNVDLQNRTLPLAQTRLMQREGGSPAERFERLIAAGEGDDAFRDEALALGRELLERAADAVATEADE